MIAKSLNFLRTFGRKEDGQMVVEFAFFVPLIFTIFMTSVELGLYQIRLMFLERALDETVRDVRLTTGAVPGHRVLKERICERAGFFDDCLQNINLEMTVVDPRNMTLFQNGAQCTDQSAPPTEANLPNGFDHDLMLLRACVKFDPVFPTSGMGRHFVKDSSGQARMVASSAFVQEPR
jgi:hypothetical protein